MGYQVYFDEKTIQNLVAAAGSQCGTYRPGIHQVSTVETAKCFVGANAGLIQEARGIPSSPCEETDTLSQLVGFFPMVRSYLSILDEFFRFALKLPYLDCELSSS
eukprot:scaffold2238_cov396-Prasinococcus_capsulatus_cf.AAC.6